MEVARNVVLLFLGCIILYLGNIPLFPEQQQRKEDYHGIFWGFTLVGSFLLSLIFWLLGYGIGWLYEPTDDFWHRTIFFSNYSTTLRSYLVLEAGILTVPLFVWLGRTSAAFFARCRKFLDIKKEKTPATEVAADEYPIEVRELIKEVQEKFLPGLAERKKEFQSAIEKVDALLLKYKDGRDGLRAKLLKKMATNKTEFGARLEKVRNDIDTCHIFLDYAKSYALEARLDESMQAALHEHFDELIETINQTVTSNEKVDEEIDKTKVIPIKRDQGMKTSPSQ